jgi:hypothetical protein
VASKGPASAGLFFGRFLQNWSIGLGYLDVGSAEDSLEMGCLGLGFMDFFSGFVCWIFC